MIMLSVAIGLFCGMMVLAIYKGMMNGRIKTVIEAESGNIQIHHNQFKEDHDPKYILQDEDLMMQEIIKIPSIKAYTERSVTTGMMSTVTGSSGVMINGIDEVTENKVSGLDRKIIEGNEFNSEKKHQLIIGKKLADKMKLSLGKKLVLTFADTTSGLVSAAFRVTGVYQSDNASFDERYVYVRKNELNELLGIDRSAHEIVLLLNGDTQTEILKKDLQQRFPQYQVESWRDLSPETELMIDTIDVYAYIIIGIILFALSFGIINTMLMAVLERTKEIGMMMALGMGKIKIFFLIIMETVILTTAGVPIGLLAAWLTNNYYHQYGMDWSGMGKEMMSSFGFSTMLYPEFPTDKIVGVMIIVVVTAICSCIMPAIKALRLKPVNAIRK